jgi:S-adenosylmethionine hydrolase
MTNLTPEDVPKVVEPGSAFKIRVGSVEISSLKQTFSEGTPGEPVAIVGSSGFIEISVNRGNAARTIGAARGAEVVVELG